MSRRPARPAIVEQAHPLSPGEEPEGQPASSGLAGDLRGRRGLAPRTGGAGRDGGSRRARPGGGRRSGPGGIIRFLVFSLVLAGVVLVVGLTALRPVVERAVVDWAAGNPGALRMPFVADLVREDLGQDLVTAASSDPAQVEFRVVPGDTASTIASRLAAEGLLRDPRAFVFIAVERGLEGQLEAGSFILRRNMTPDQLVTGLLQARDLSVTISLREGLRIEQIAAKLQTLPLTMDVRAFYELATRPPASLLADYPWLDLPKGASLEGFLAPDTYRVLPDTSPEELVRMLLDRFREIVGPERMAVPKERGLTFYQVVTLASIVEHEAVVDRERPLIAGVYENRLRRKMLLQADPTVFYGHDTLELANLPFEQWPTYLFWAPFGQKLAEVEFPPELAGYQTYRHKGLIPGPISTPSLASIDAALAPDTSAGYLYFVAKGDGSNTHAFARTFKEHQANLKKYGYQP